MANNKRKNYQFLNAELKKEEEAQGIFRKQNLRQKIRNFVSPELEYKSILAARHREEVIRNKQIRFETAEKFKENPVTVRDVLLHTKLAHNERDLEIISKSKIELYAGPLGYPEVVGLSDDASEGHRIEVGNKFARFEPEEIYEAKIASKQEEHVKAHSKELDNVSLENDKVTVRDVLLHTGLVSDGNGDRDLQAASASGNVGIRNSETGQQEWPVRQFDDASWATHITYKDQVVEFDVLAVVNERRKNNYINGRITHEEALTPRIDEVSHIPERPDKFGVIPREKMDALNSYVKAFEAYEKESIKYLSDKPFVGTVVGSVEVGRDHYSVIKGEGEWMLVTKSDELNSLVGKDISIVGQMQKNGYLRAEFTNVSAADRRDENALEAKGLVKSPPISNVRKTEKESSVKPRSPKAKKNKGGFER